MKKYILTIFCLAATLCFSQSGIKSWDVNYIEVNPQKIIKSEIEYANAVEKDTTQGSQYYIALRKFRFMATFTGNKRPLNKTVLNSMQRVLKIKTGNAEFLNGLVSKEFEFNIGTTTVWMPIQNQLIAPFESEVKKGDRVLLYTLFTNEHPSKGRIINTFLVSEFTTEWTD
jgi:hypothetical protein